MEELQKELDKPEKIKLRDLIFEKKVYDIFEPSFSSVDDVN